jgi:DNA polymerase-3 subunit gamma/tau
VLDYDYYFKLTDNFLNSDLSVSFLSFNEILENGFDGHHFITGLASHFRDLLVCKDAKTVELLEVGSNIKQKYLQQSEKCSVQFLMKAIEIANKADLSYKGSKNKRLQVELALMQLCSIIQDQSIEKKKTNGPKQIKTKENTSQTVAEPKEGYSERKKKHPYKESIEKLRNFTQFES